MVRNYNYDGKVSILVLNSDKTGPDHLFCRTYVLKFWRVVVVVGGRCWWSLLVVVVGSWWLVVGCWWLVVLWVLFVVEGREFVQCWMTRGGRA